MDFNKIVEIRKDLDFSPTVSEYANKLCKIINPEFFKPFVIAYIMERVLTAESIGFSSSGLPLDMVVQNMLRELREQVVEYDIICMSEQDIDNFKDSLTKLLNDEV
jgi:hypothetical protein